VATAPAPQAPAKLGPTAPTVPPAPAAPAPAPRQTIVNETVIEKTNYIQAPSPVYSTPPVVVAPGMATAPAVVQPPQEGLSLGEAAVAVGATMALKGVMDMVAPSPEKRMENQMKDGERKLDEQARQLEAMKSELARIKSTPAPAPAPAPGVAQVPVPATP